MLDKTFHDPSLYVYLKVSLELAFFLVLLLASQMEAH